MSLLIFSEFKGIDKLPFSLKPSESLANKSLIKQLKTYNHILMVGINHGINIHLKQTRNHIIFRNNSKQQFCPIPYIITLKKLFLFSRYSNFCDFFPLLFRTFQIQKDKWKWNNLLCHELTFINLQM